MKKEDLTSSRFNGISNNSSQASAMQDSPREDHQVKSDSVKSSPSSSSSLGLPNFGPSTSRTLSPHAHKNAEPGELWLSVKKNENPWPVVICDEEMLLILSKGHRRPANAPKEDGTWRGEYGLGGRLAEKRCYATMRSGANPVLWVVRGEMSRNSIKLANLIVGVGRPENVSNLSMA